MHGTRVAVTTLVCASACAAVSGADEMRVLSGGKEERAVHHGDGDPECVESLEGGDPSALDADVPHLAHANPYVFYSYDCDAGHGFRSMAVATQVLGPADARGVRSGSPLQNFLEMNVGIVEAPNGAPRETSLTVKAFVSDARLAGELPPRVAAGYERFVFRGEDGEPRLDLSPPNVAVYLEAAAVAAWEEAYRARRALMERDARFLKALQSTLREIWRYLCPHDFQWPPTPARDPNLVWEGEGRVGYSVKPSRWTECRESLEVIDT